MNYYRLLAECFENCDRRINPLPIDSVIKIIQGYRNMHFDLLAQEVVEFLSKAENDGDASKLLSKIDDYYPLAVTRKRLRWDPYDDSNSFAGNRPGPAVKYVHFWYICIQTSFLELDTELIKAFPNAEALHDLQHHPQRD